MPGLKAATIAKKVVEPDVKTLERMLYYLKLTREAEQLLERVLYRQGKIVGGVYVGRGQEAIAVGSAIQLVEGDVVFPSHRDFAAWIIRGFTLRDVFLNWLGRAHGPTRGRENTNHFGDVTTSRGDVHEAMNLAAVWTLPVIFICNNNAYAYSTPTRQQYAVKDLSARAPVYGMPGMTIDGNDVLKVYDAARQAIKRARAGKGPLFIECKTFRMTGHSAHDPAQYVPKELFEMAAKDDPLARFEKELAAMKIVDSKRLGQLEQQIAKEIDEAVAFAESSSLP